MITEENRVKKNERQRKYYQKNKEKLKEKWTKYAKENRMKVSKRQSDWYKENRLSVLQQQKEYKLNKKRKNIMITYVATSEKEKLLDTYDGEYTDDDKVGIFCPMCDSSRVYYIKEGETDHMYGHECLNCGHMGDF